MKKNGKVFVVPRAQMKKNALMAAAPVAAAMTRSRAHKNQLWPSDSCGGGNMIYSIVYRKWWCVVWSYIISFDSYILFICSAYV